MPHIPGSFDEFGETIERGAQNVSQSVKKSVGQTVKSTAGQVKPAPSDFVKQLYGIKEEIPQDQEQQKPDAQSQKVTAPGEIISPFPIRSEEEIKASGGPVLSQLSVLPRIEGKTGSLSEQLTGQSSSEAGLNMRLDPTKEMTEDEKRILTETQKEKREEVLQHNRSYVKGPLDNAPTLEEQVMKVRRNKEEEENQKNQEEEDEKDQERKEKEQQSRQLEPPRGKVRGASNLAIDKGKKQAEIHRGTGG